MQGRHDDGDKAPQQIEILKEHGIPDAAHHAQAGLLGQRAHHQTGNQSQQRGARMEPGPSVLKRSQEVQPPPAAPEGPH